MTVPIRSSLGSMKSQQLNSHSDPSINGLLPIIYNKCIMFHAKIKCQKEVQSRTLNILVGYVNLILWYVG